MPVGGQSTQEPTTALSALADGTALSALADRVALSALADRVEIRELTATYNRHFDSGNAEAFAATFTPDGVMEVEGGFRVEGTAGLEEMCRRTPPGIIHVTVDSIVQVEGDEATQDVRLLVLSKPTEKTPTPALDRTGQYKDRLVRTPDGWRFAHRYVTLDGGM